MSLTIGSALGSGLAGVDVAARRVATAAANVANVGSASSSFQPLDLQQVGGPTGAPRPVVRTADVTPLKTYDPTNPAAAANGVVSLTNVSLEGETATLITAQRALEASLAAISTADIMLGSLFDEEA